MLRRAFREVGWDVAITTHVDANGFEKVNLIAAPSGQSVDDPSTELAFLCHTDTVPFAPDWAGATNPFVKDEHVYGCGACDVKGFLACLLTAVGEVATGDLIHGLRIVLTADEEVGCLGAHRLFAADLMRPSAACYWRTYFFASCASR